MAIALKLGNGGYSLEPYDTVNGEFVKVSLSVEGKDGQTHNVTKFEEFIDAVLTSAQKAIYDSWDEDKKNLVKQRAFPEFQQQMQNKVDEINAKAKSGVKSAKHRESAEEVINEIGDIITKDFVNSYFSSQAIKNRMNNGTLGNNGVTITRAGSVKSSSGSTGISYMTALLQEELFGTSFFTEGNQSDFDSAYDVITQHKGLDRYKISDENYRDDIIDAMTRGNKFLKIHRNPGGASSAHSKQEIADSFFGEIKNVKTLLGGCGGNYQSVIYCSMDRRYSEVWDYNGFVMDGYIDLEHCYIFNNFVDNANGGSSSRNTEWAKLRDYNNVGVLINNLRYSLAQYGISQQEMDFFVDDFKKNLKNNGFAAMLFGADAVLGNRGQLDIVNPTIAKFLRYKGDN